MLPDFCTLLVALLALSSAARAAAQAQAAPVPPEMRNSYFAVTVNNQTVDVAHAASNYEFVNFDTTGPVEISITAADPGFWDRGVDIDHGGLACAPRIPRESPKPSAFACPFPPSSPSRGPPTF